MKNFINNFFKKYSKYSIFAIFSFCLLSTGCNREKTKEKQQSVSISKLSNGMTLAIDKMDEVDSVVVQVGVPVGSQNELREENGISHFLEHMAFKGTKTRTYKQIAEAVDNVGGYTNAYTNKDWTIYLIKVLKKDVELTFDILSDMLFNSTYPQEEIEKERGVILQELAMYADDPDRVVEDMLFIGAYGDTAFGRSVGGDPNNIKKFNREDFIKYREKNYRLNEMVISVCGNVDEKQIKKLANKYFSHHKIKNKERSKEKIEYIGNHNIKTKNDLQQVKIILGYNGIQRNLVHAPNNDLKKLIAIDVGSMILGHGMSSRLFQEMREKHGIVYLIYTSIELTKDTSLFRIDTGLAPDKISKFVPAIKQELKKITENITDEEMNRAKNQYEANIKMSNEDPYGRSYGAIVDLFNYGRIVTDEEIMKIVNSLTKQDVLVAMKEILNGKPTLAVYGNVSSVDIEYLKKEFK